MLLAITAAWATDPGVHPGYGDGRYRLDVRAEYAYNLTWQHHGNLDINAFMPVNKGLELEGRVQLSTANVYTMGGIIRPKIELPVGELFLETEALYTNVRRAWQHDLVMAVSIGYRMDYISGQIGWYGRFMRPFDMDWHSENHWSTELNNLAYNLEVSCRPQANPWNITARISNLDDFRIERHWQLLFSLEGRYDIDDHWRVSLLGQIKPTGMFHMNAEFYGAIVRGGFSYRF